MNREQMIRESRTSRWAGLVYLVVVVAGMFSLAYVPSRMAASDPQAMLGNIVAGEALFRAGVAGFMVMQVAFLLLPLVLYRLLRQVNPAVAVLMVVLALTSVPIGLACLPHKLDALSLLTGAQYRLLLTPGQAQAMALAALDAYGNGLLMAKLFWGLWLLPFGYLVLKSGFLPKLLGALLMLGCLGYLINVFGELLYPHYADARVAAWASLPAAIGEIGTCLWLLLVGARRPKSAVA